MAKFNPEIRDEPGQNYTSQGSRIIQPSEDTSVATMLKGFGVGVEALFGAGNAVMTGKIKKEVQDNVDFIRASQGVDTWAELFPGVPQTTPMTPEQIRKSSGFNQGPLDITPGAARAEGPPQTTVPGIDPKPGTPLAAGLPGPDLNPFRYELERIHAAYGAGRLSDTYYYTALERMVKVVRARYPGFREDIDDAVKSITGITPANALRAAIENDLKEAAKKQETKAEEQAKFIRSHQQYLTPDEYTGKTPQEQMQIIQQRQAAEKNIELQQKQINLSQDTEKVKQSAAARAFQSTLETTLGASVEKARELISKLATQTASGKPLTEEQIKDVRAAFAKIKLDQKTAIDRIADKQGDDGTPSFATMIGDQTKVDNIKKAHMSQIDAMEQYLIDGNFGAFNNYANALQTNKSLSEYKLVTMDNWTQTLAAVERAFGKDAVSIFLMQTDPKTGKQNFPRLMDTFGKMLLMEGAVKGSNGEPLAATIERKVKEAVAVGDRAKNISDAIETVIKDYTRMITDPNTPPDIVKGLTSFMNKKENSDLISSYSKSKDRETLFRTMVNPQIAAVMNKSPATKQEYTDFAMNTFTKLFVKESAELAKVQQDPYVFVDYNPGTGQFEVVPTKEGMKYFQSIAASRVRDRIPGSNEFERDYLNSPENLAREYIRKQYSFTVNSVNGILANMDPIAKEYGIDRTKLLKGFIQVASPKKVNENSFLSNLANKIKGIEPTDETLKPYRGVPLNPFGDTPGKQSSVPGNVTEEEKVLRQFVTKGQGAERPDSFSEMTPEFRSKLVPFLQAAREAGVLPSGGIISGYRSKTLQGNLQKTNAYAADPDASNHPKGLAVDLDFQDYKFKNWAFLNAGRFGFHFPYKGKYANGREDNHMELY